MSASVSHWHGPPVTIGGRLEGEVHADVVIVGAGFTGLWTAIALRERDPALQIAIVEAETVGYGATGRNGGFVDASLTHGLHNGLRHFAGEMGELLRLGAENFTELAAFIAEHDISCDFRPVGVIDVATQPWQVAELQASAALHHDHGLSVTLHDRAAVRAQVDSPTYLAGLEHHGSSALVDPVALARGLAQVAVDSGVTLYEHSPALAVRQGSVRDGPVRVDTERGAVRAEAAVLATNAYSHHLLRRTSTWFVPVYDYVLMTKPLTDEQLARVGWRNRQGLADAANQFHYYRLTADNRILWGGYDAVYRFGNKVGPEFDHRRATYDVLAANFRLTFPQLADVSFDRWWGGPIATTSRFTVTFGEAFGGHVLWALGYTGLGVAATRFAARVLADKLLQPDSSLLSLDFTTTKPVPFPPEPLRSVGIKLTRRALARADVRHGRRGPWLKALDAIGMGFDS